MSENENKTERVIMRTRVTEREHGGGTVGTSPREKLSQSERARVRVREGEWELQHCEKEEESENARTE